MPSKTVKLTLEDYLKRLETKLEELVGKKEYDSSTGKYGFIMKRWASYGQKEQFLTWLASEFSRDKSMYAAFHRYGSRSNGKNACAQMANEWDWQYGPKEP